MCNFEQLGVGGIYLSAEGDKVRIDHDFKDGTFQGFILRSNNFDIVACRVAFNADGTPAHDNVYTFGKPRGMCGTLVEMVREPFGKHQPEHTCMTKDEYNRAWSYPYNRNIGDCRYIDGMTGLVEYNEAELAQEIVELGRWHS